MGYIPDNIVNDDDEDFGIAAAMGVSTQAAKEHMSAPVKEDIFVEEGRHGVADGYDIYAGIGRFYAEDEVPLIEAIIGIVSDIGLVFELEELDPEPSIEDSEIRWYREFSVDGDISSIVNVGYDQNTMKYRLAITNEKAKSIYAVSGLNTPADIPWLIADAFKYSQS